MSARGKVRPVQTIQPDPAVILAAEMGRAWDEACAACTAKEDFKRDHGSDNDALVLAYHHASERALAYERLLRGTPATTATGAVLRLALLLEQVYFAGADARDDAEDDAEAFRLATSDMARELALLAHDMGIDWKAAGLVSVSDNLGLRWPWGGR